MPDKCSTLELLFQSPPLLFSFYFLRRDLTDFPGHLSLVTLLPHPYEKLGLQACTQTWFVIYLCQELGMYLNDRHCLPCEILGFIPSTTKQSNKMMLIFKILFHQFYLSRSLQKWCFVLFCSAGIEPRASSMLGKCSTTVLYPQPYKNISILAI